MDIIDCAPNEQQDLIVRKNNILKIKSNGATNDFRGINNELDDLLKEQKPVKPQVSFKLSKNSTDS